MTKIESQSMQTIKRMCEEHHLNIKDTYSIMKRLLELYRNAIGYRNSITGGANAILLCGVLLWDEAKHRKFA